MLDAAAFAAFVHHVFVVWAPLSRGTRTGTTIVCIASYHLHDVSLLDLLRAYLINCNHFRRWSFARYNVAVSIRSRRRKVISGATSDVRVAREELANILGAGDDQGGMILEILDPPFLNVTGEEQRPAVFACLSMFNPTPFTHEPLFIESSSFKVSLRRFSGISSCRIGHLADTIMANI